MGANCFLSLSLYHPPGPLPSHPPPLPCRREDLAYSAIADVSPWLYSHALPKASERHLVKPRLLLLLLLLLRRRRRHGKDE